MSRRDSTLLPCIRDLFVIGAILAGLNWSLSSSDFGWLTLNPTPWLLLPILIGARYGLIPGTISGILASTLITVIRSRSSELSASTFVEDHLYELSALILLGFLAGQWRQLQKSRHTELQAENEQLQALLENARAEVSLGIVSKQDLQRQLALHNVQLANLDEDLRKILVAPDGDFLTALLDLIFHHCQIHSAAMYQADGEKLTRVAAIHPTAPLKEKLTLGQTPLAAKALDEQSIAAVRDPMATTPDQPFLAAFPWNDGSHQGILLVQEMPLEAVSWENLSRVELIIHWTFALARWRRKTASNDPLRTIPVEDFMVLIGQALLVEQTHRVPSVVLRADFLDSNETHDAKGERALLETLPQTAVASRVPTTGSLLVLLPFGGQSEGEALGRALQKAGPRLRCYHYLTTGITDVNHFWSHLMEG